MTCLTPEYERKLTPLNSLAAASAGVRVVTPFTSSTVRCSGGDLKTIILKKHCIGYLYRKTLVKVELHQLLLPIYTKHFDTLLHKLCLGRRKRANGLAEIQSDPCRLLVQGL